MRTQTELRLFGFTSLKLAAMAPAALAISLVAAPRTTLSQTPPLTTTLESDFAQAFRFNLSTEPSHADPARINSSESNYFLMNIHRGLYTLSKTGEPTPEIAESCRPVSSKRYRCAIKKSAKWSDGAAITAEDFVLSWRRLVAKDAKGIGVQILSNVRNAVAAHRGQAEVASLAIQALDSHRLEIELNQADSDFLAKLAHPALSVTRMGHELHREAFKTATAAKKPIPTAGPYVVTDWSKPDRIRLSPNPHYSGIRKSAGSIPRPTVEILIVDDDETALNLYREGTLSLLRRLPTHYLKAWQVSPELHQIPVIRFDYLGFGPELKDQRDMRQALAKSLRYEELKSLYSALGIPGCPGILPQWMSSVPCHEFHLDEAKMHFAQVPAEFRNRRMQLAFSKLGGDDIQKGMEWVQAQWKNHLSFPVELKPTEQGVYVNQLRTSPPAIFRKGVGLDRASCLAALEIFTKSDPENYIRFENTKYEEIVQRLQRMANPLSSAGRKLCMEGVKILIDEAAIIPLGQIHFSILAKPNFEGWVLTPLNQLDLGLLSRRQSGSK